MRKFNFLHTPDHNRETNVGHVRTRANAVDRFEGKRGRDWLDARAQEPEIPREVDVPATPAWMLR